MGFFTFVGYMVVGLIGLGCAIALFAGVVGWELEAKERERRDRAFQEFSDLEFLFQLESADR